MHQTVLAMTYRQFVRSWIVDEDGRPRGRPNVWFDDQDGVQVVQSLFRVEDLATDFSTIKRLCGIDDDRALPHLNKSERPDYRHFYDDDLAEFVAQHCASEIRRFGYAF